MWLNATYSLVAEEANSHTLNILLSFSFYMFSENEQL